ncbi:AAA family ATPase [Alphaproteobacteria bacterium]|nr:AAA family ATPase [Alphaproteobacteria bacterium]
MNLENFDQKSTIIINAAFNYASENNYAFLTPLNLLEVMIKTNDDVRSTLVNFSVDCDKLYLESKRISKNSNKKKQYEETSVQGNVLVLIEQAQKETKKIGYKKVNCNVILLVLTSEISPQSKLLLEKHGITYNKLYESLVSKKNIINADLEFIEKYTTDVTSLALDNKIDPIVGREEEIKRTIQIISRRTKNNPILIGEPGVGKTAIAEGIGIKIIENQIPDSLKNSKLLSLDLSSMLAGAKYRGEFEERLKILLNEINNMGNVILFIDEIHTIIGTGASEGSLDVANIIKPALARGTLQCIGATTLDEYRKYFEKDAALTRRFQPIFINEPTVDDTISILRGLKEKYELHHGISISDKAIVSAALLSNRYLATRKLPDKAIDLIDEAASKRKLELKSKPAKAEKIESQIIKNKIEIESLENDKEESRKRINILEDENRDLSNTLNKILKEWKSYEEKINNLNTLKENLENKKIDLKTAERKGDLNLAGKLAHLIIPEIEKDIKTIEKNNKIILDNKKVTENDIATILSNWTGIPTTKILETEKSSLLNLENILHSKIIGQDKAIAAISSVIKRSRTGINNPNKPIGSFLFLGPTGVGKTEIAKTLANYLFNDEKELLTIDMSEFSEKHSVSKLIGSPPGYVGFDNGGRLTKEVRERPFRVILFDEIEKAHPEIFNIFLQILDEGRLSDSQGKHADFKNTIIVLTSNIGSSTLLSGEKEKVFEDVKKKFKPEFLNRLDEIIIFDKLSKKDIVEIIEKELSEFKKRLEERNIHIDFSKNIIHYLTLNGYSAEYGARPLKRLIEKELGTFIADEIIKNNIKDGHKTFLDIKENKLSYKIIN